ncbi:MAG: DEAD/DEAH box helicase [Cellvibrionaceae bacterium]
MSYALRPYQQDAVDATVKHFRASPDPAVIVLPTGSGKSLVIAELARIARRRILVLTHVKELVEQNHQKYESYGLKASVFSAGLSRKETDQQVVFASVQSAAKNLEDFSQDFSLLIIDECHRVSTEKDSQYQILIRHLKAYNRDLKILGLTATPYRLDRGWIYQWHMPDKRFCTDQDTAFKSCIFELPLRLMIHQGYLTKARLIDAPVAFYDFEVLRSNSSSSFDETDIDRVIAKSQRATAKITEQIIELSRDRKGIMIFAATVRHAKEILSYLPAHNSALILGDMRIKARDSVITAFKNRQIKYLVNVSVLTTGFDAPHVDLIAILRPTDSVGLYQQIVGRGLRLCADKEDCLVLDYAGNTHDLFRPQIDDTKPNSKSVAVEVACPLCQHSNQFWGLNDDDGNLIEHYGRRCQGMILDDANQAPEQCTFRFRFKECDQCGAENDIAARQCHQCEKLLVDPDTKLKEALKLNDVKVIRCSGMSFSQSIKNDSQRLTITYHDEDGGELKDYFHLSTQAQKTAFSHNFVKQHQRISGENYQPSSVEDAIRNEHRYRHPDFVIARREKRYWTIRDRIFDYEGIYRRANEL